jgi:hypothetical protein
MIIETVDPGNIPLQVLAQNLDGTPKTVLTSASVRVYHLSGHTELEDLHPVNMVQVGDSSTWRYVWEPANLPIGHYFVEYTLTDPDGALFVAAEDMDIRDIARQADVDFIKKVESGRWRIHGNQMTFYEEDGSTPLMQFHLRDIHGAPSNVSIFERVPV